MNGLNERFKEGVKEIFRLVNNKEDAPKEDIFNETRSLGSPGLQKNGPVPNR